MIMIFIINITHGLMWTICNYTEYQKKHYSFKIYIFSIYIIIDNFIFIEKETKLDFEVGRIYVSSILVL